ncbi:hypothetical protein FPRO05_14178 [Fusarium proliferatum]|uniref:Uncharacterized protein n=1 Tax=Gibberella intermedia TaxID=948311 RepID=A0A365MTK8_GIBIN|nr:hypothetical protein FPRO05_14178 [Fusarium proliferatum]
MGAAKALLTPLGTPRLKRRPSSHAWEPAANYLFQVHRTGPEPGQFTHKTHAKDGGKASIVPQKLQEKLPESVERAVPNAIHNTDDAGGQHRKQ